MLYKSLPKVKHIPRKEGCAHPVPGQELEPRTEGKGRVLTEKDSESSKVCSKKKLSANGSLLESKHSSRKAGLWHPALKEKNFEPRIETWEDMMGRTF